MSLFGKEGLVRRGVKEALQRKDNVVVLAKAMTPEETAEHIFDRIMETEWGESMLEREIRDPDWFSRDSEISVSMLLTGYPWEVPYFKYHPELFREAMEANFDITFHTGPLADKPVEVEVIEALRDLILAAGQQQQ